MDGKEYRQQMLDELSRTLNDLDDREIEQAVKEITTAKRIFFCRSRESRTYDERICHAG